VAVLLTLPTPAARGSDEATRAVLSGPIDLVQWDAPVAGDFRADHGSAGAACSLAQAAPAEPAAPTVSPAVVAGPDLADAGPLEILQDPVRSVAAAGETTSVNDDADDPAIWLHPGDPNLSLVIGTDKATGLFSWDLAGNRVQFIPNGEPNNVDLRYNFPLAGSRVDIVATGNETTNRIEIYKVNPATRQLENVGGNGIASNLGRTYGFCMYHSPISGKFYAIVTHTSVEQWELVDSGGTVTGRLVRSFRVGSQTEGCAADDERATLFIGEEDVGIWRYGAEPGDGSTRQSIDTTGSGGHLTADVEGLAIYYGPNTTGYLLASSQGNDTFTIYNRQPPHSYLMTFRVTGGQVDAVGDADGIDVLNSALGSRYPQGLFVTHDGSNDSGANNFKLVRWEDIARSISPALLIDPTSYNPRGAGGNPPPSTTAAPATATRTATAVGPTATRTATSPGPTATRTPTRTATSTAAGPTATRTATRTATALAPIVTSSPTAGPPPGGAASGLWISREEVLRLPMSGAAWSQLKSAADRALDAPDLSDQDDGANVQVMAKALAFARTGDGRYRNDVIAALRTITTGNTEDGGRTLALGRELAAYVIAADLIDLRTADPGLDASFRSKLRQLLNKNLDGRTLVSTHEDRPNNWGTHAGASRAAVAVYLGDRTELERTARVFKGWLGDRASYAGFDYGDLDWQCDPARPVGVNPLGCVKQGRNIDGALPEEMRRGGGFRWPPSETGYAWEGMQGALAQAHILARAGYPTWDWQDRALLRATQFLYGIGWVPEGDDTWQPWLVNWAYGTSFATVNPARPGKNVGWTDWTHASRQVAPPGPTATRTATSAGPPAATATRTATSGAPPTATTAAGPTATTGPDPLGGFDPRLIPVELQAWWAPNFGHIHAAARLPVLQKVSGNLDLNVRVVLHDNPSSWYTLRFDNDTGDLVGRVDFNPNRVCPYDGVTSTNCAWNVPVSLDTRRLGSDGWHTLRIRATVDTPDGNRWTTSSDIPLCVSQSGRDCTGSVKALTGKGWYETTGYSNAQIRNDSVPIRPVGGVHTFYVRQDEGGERHMQVALDKSHFIPAVGNWPAQQPTTGTILFDQDQNVSDWMPIQVDTRALANGWHAFAVQVTSEEGDTSECSYCRGEMNHSSGVVKLWFYVQN
jgi:myo-inositol-hexaphosphate 3-phosphohydrolase